MPERIKIYNSKQDRVVETTQKAFDQTLSKRGWVLHEPEKYIAPAPLSKPTVEKFVKEPVKVETEQPKGEEIDLGEDAVEFVPELIEGEQPEKEDAKTEPKTRGRKPKAK